MTLVDSLISVFGLGTNYTRCPRFEEKTVAAQSLFD